MKAFNQFQVIMLLALLTAGCNLVDDVLNELEPTEPEENFNYFGVDFLTGEKESGTVTKELHFLNTDDSQPKREIEFVYQGNKLVKKIYTAGEASTNCVEQVDSMCYGNGMIERMIRFRSPEDNSTWLEVSEICNYKYPDEDTRICVRRNKSGHFIDSVVYTYKNQLLVKELHFQSQLSYGYIYEYNSSGKLLKKSGLNGGNYSAYIFDENGQVKSKEIYVNGELSSFCNYEHEQTGNVLTIKSYQQNIGENQISLSAIKVFQDGKLKEFVQHSTNDKGDEWWCTRYEYL